MARLSEQELICELCSNTKEIPVCCGREMEYDNVVFFCEICNKEIKPFKCCNREMVIHTKILDLKKELFKKL